MLILGDLHGNYKFVTYLMNSRHLKNESILQVGDFGVGFSGNPDYEVKRLLELDESLGENNCILYVTRGNHDDPQYFDGYYMYDNLKLLPDYTVLDIEGRQVLFVGGAISIDRVLRKVWNSDEVLYGTSKRHYWYDEGFVMDSERLLACKDIDVVITHTAPSFVWPTELNGLVHSYIKQDNQLYGDLMNERKQLDDMYEYLKMHDNNPSFRWYYGHYHSSQITDYRGTEFRLLGINEIYELRKDVEI